MEPSLAHSVPPGEEGAGRVYKLVLLGSSDVGKSSVTLRYVKDEFRESIPTTGCAFFTQRVCLQNRTLQFEIWDTAGQERYHSVCHLYYRGANAALLVYDISRKETFLRAQLWLQELEKCFPHGELVIALIGNKSDLQEERQVSREDGQSFADTKQLFFMETSARTGAGVQEAFEAVACELLILKHQTEDRTRRRDTGVNIEGTCVPHLGRNCCNT